MFPSAALRMIGLKGRMVVIDNSGATLAECVNVLKVKTRKKSTGFGTVGDEIVCVVNKARPVPQLTPGAPALQKVRKGDVRRAVIVRTKKEVVRPDGRVIRFDDNACVLLNAKSEMLGTRINGVVSAELSNDPNNRWAKILGLATKIV
ncbi:hypothetical protein CcaverHIS002_0703750 [Cutaneotrichosporon cavernicola]|uniref:Large ribosomal subunit protein uL14m n=1 Tax=Cutaneotrichosporon cavernicola TaxID=279322 RepID=A0AA48QYQ6_9TREE|nr:uncharacterized protein CcaverHIS019_0703830 [Cutaneotrichosporon cavernicola]BEJ18056.1 hypothetical protein CspHIS471_0703330 [Cutaneotrichosporon sp. HIS471]BEI87029.1 hypothetical protein CcaverHIS002_0703750 [Cutaneotrichosporon cavernicola]BEI94802.1 hypothetical protein CcaverHIS019_0703830 [Cutaneotrichosporon cavernicola]BEJ02577.1 hypothetical protein CcaverHIS631_0703720 [Cutaneotrichosporon cavernicola]BEJ10333.1 hypothetical protein CcaverHIS641_0703680 [Cutaneotrichosporon cav